MNRGAVVVGTGGHARVVASLLAANSIDVLGFFDFENETPKPEIIDHSPLLGPLKDLEKYKSKITQLYLAVGDNSKRRKLYERYRDSFKMPSLTHPSAVVERNVTVGEASQICMGALLASEAKIGCGCIINTGTSVDHESSVGDFVHLAPQVVVAGRTTIGEGTFVGMNASIAPNIRVGRDAVIGAGAIVLRDVPERAKVLGVYH